MNNNKNDFLCNAKTNIHDEFYTRYEDIEEEMSHYFCHFKDKIVYCNCDDPFKSNFVKYFLDHFNALGLKELIATCYDGAPFGYYQLSLFEEENELDLKTPYKLVVKEVGDKTDINSVLEKENNSLTILKEHGDFRSKECIEILKGADIVVTNPPFSLWTKHISQLLSYNKKFLIIGNINNFTCKAVFKHICLNEVWLGSSHRNDNFLFIAQENYDNYSSVYKVDQDGNGCLKINGTRWLTNLTFENQYPIFEFANKEYDKKEYKKCDNIDALYIDEINNIPNNYFEEMVVPITFLDKYNPNQFELLGVYKGTSAEQYYVKKPEFDYYGTKSRFTYEPITPILNEVCKYKRLLIRRKFLTNE